MIYYISVISVNTKIKTTSENSKKFELKNKHAIVIIYTETARIKTKCFVCEFPIHHCKYTTDYFSFYPMS